MQGSAAENKKENTKKTSWTVLLLVCRVQEEDTSKLGISSKPQSSFD